MLICCNNNDTVTYFDSVISSRNNNFSLSHNRCNQYAFFVFKSLRGIPINSPPFLTRNSSASTWSFISICSVSTLLPYRILHCSDIAYNAVSGNAFGEIKLSTSNEFNISGKKFCLLLQLLLILCKPFASIETTIFSSSIPVSITTASVFQVLLLSKALCLYHHVCIMTASGMCSQRYSHLLNLFR